MAQQMSIEEMVRMIDDVIGGSFEVVLWKDGETYVEPSKRAPHTLELKSIDMGGAEVGTYDIPVTGGAVWEYAGVMEVGIPYALGHLPYGIVQYIAEREPAFRGFIERDMRP